MNTRDGLIEVRKGVYEPPNYKAPDQLVDSKRIVEIVHSILSMQKEAEPECKDKKEVPALNSPHAV